jgi:hypothetical protein
MKTAVLYQVFPRSARSAYQRQKIPRMIPGIFIITFIPLTLLPHPANEVSFADR